MTSPTEPPKESVRDRISNRLSTDKRGRLIDADARHTRNVSWMFYALIVVIMIIAIGGLAFGFWESNLKPLANVDGTEVSRGDWEDRQKLEQFRADRAESLVSTAVAEGTIDSDLANRRFNNIVADLPATEAEVMTELVDLLYQQQLAVQEGVELSEAELDEALADQGGFPEARLIEALIVLTAEHEQGQLPTDAGIADAKARAEAALAELVAGTATAEELAETFGPANYETAWVAEGDINDAAWERDIFSADPGGITDITQASTGEQLFAVVNDIAPAEADPGFRDAAYDEVGEEIIRRNIELEALAAKLQDQITTEVVEAEYPQVRLAEILIERSPQNTDDTAGEARASHILYAPETPLDEDGNPTPVADLAEDDPAWAEAQTEAERAARQLALVDDVEARMDAFAKRAAKDSDGPSASRGGDLGWFPDGAMLTEFNDAIWKGVDLEQGDILGPVRTQYGWHVIQFDQFRSSLEVRVDEALSALAEEDADFAAVAAELSDGPDAAEGGQTGWRVLDEFDDDTTLALSVTEPGGTTSAIDGFDGTRVYQKIEEGTRPLEPEEAAARAQTAFDDWYFERYDEADQDGRISIDDSIYE